MKKILLPCLFTALTLLSIAGRAQNLKTLETNNGFKNHKLGSKYTSLYGIKNKDEDGSEKVEITYTTDKIGEIPVRRIELFYLNDTLAKILVHVSPENYTKLIEACKSNFGQPTADLSDNEATRKAKNEAVNSGNNYKDHYIWKTKKFSMVYFYTYPKVNGSAYSARELYLNYSLNDYTQRLKRVKNGNYSGKDF
jgi:hypothetical protein